MRVRKAQFLFVAILAWSALFAGLSVWLAAGFLQGDRESLRHTAVIWILLLAIGGGLWVAFLRHSIRKLGGDDGDSSNVPPRPANHERPVPPRLGGVHQVSARSVHVGLEADRE
jgi:hypothetical protein